jgi:deoxycytidylate deaminase
MSYSHYFALEKKLRTMGMRIEREELISEFTNNRTSSLKELTACEYEHMIRNLNNMVQKQNVADKMNTMRRKVIACLAKSGYVDSTGRSDMKRINQWCVTHGHAHKTLNEYDGVELQKLIIQAESLYDKFLKRY